MGMIGLAANSGPFFMRVNSNAAVFAPHFNDVCEWNFGLFRLHRYLLVSFNAPSRAFAVHGPAAPIPTRSMSAEPIELRPYPVTFFA